VAQNRAGLNIKLLPKKETTSICPCFRIFNSKHESNFRQSFIYEVGSKVLKRFEISLN
jgi:hypothetical protein